MSLRPSWAGVPRAPSLEHHSEAIGAYRTRYSVASPAGIDFRLQCVVGGHVTGGADPRGSEREHDLRAGGAPEGVVGDELGAVFLAGVQFTDLHGDRVVFLVGVAERGGRRGVRG